MVHRCATLEHLTDLLFWKTGVSQIVRRSLETTAEEPLGLFMASARTQSTATVAAGEGSHGVLSQAPGQGGRTPDEIVSQGPVLQYPQAGHVYRSSNGPAAAGPPKLSPPFPSTNMQTAPPPASGHPHGTSSSSGVLARARIHQSDVASSSLLRVSQQRSEGRSGALTGDQIGLSCWGTGGMSNGGNGRATISGQAAPLSSSSSASVLNAGPLQTSPSPYANPQQAVHTAAAADRTTDQPDPRLPAFLIPAAAGGGEGWSALALPSASFPPPASAGMASPAFPPSAPGHSSRSVPGLGPALQPSQSGAPFHPPASTQAAGHPLIPHPHLSGPFPTTPAVAIAPTAVSGPPQQQQQNVSGFAPAPGGVSVAERIQAGQWTMIRNTAKIPRDAGPL
eukprot:Cvel_21842.t1-p1 / transcript=Cvel_21842.t1 / gene=Cvel_21842 / organism=Chromera_velia_CCMP2878 / gene_product=hypothetical protein / transcript_product=hypothetical protein / location=Cvel_scaffold2086:270-6701(-) / protein_length=393 / sequence_SO=supercontig / SO=protein_coding / is_pseudo=false